MGVDVLEMDLRQTSDGILIVFHNEGVEGTTDGKGPVQALSLGQVKALDAGYRWSSDGEKTHPFRGQGIRVPTLEEVFQAFPHMRLNLEIKPPSPDVATALCGFIGEFNKEESVLVASFHQEVMERFRADCPEVATAATFKETFWFVVLNRLFLGSRYRPGAEAFQVPPRAGDVDVLTPRFIRTAKRLNLRVQAWTVDDLEDIEELLAMGVDGIMTDYPDRLMKLLSKPDPPEKR
jgi:glycerophosphoryl diester phosphodiesterase